MLIIRDLFYQISICESYAIYTNDYYIDKNGNILTETDRLDVYEYGDIIIQTPSTKYIIQKVYSAYNYAVEIMEYIKKHYNDDVIYINMDELYKCWEHHKGKLKIEAVEQSESR